MLTIAVIIVLCVALAATAAKLLALRGDHARLVALHGVASHDDLTGLDNRHRFNEELRNHLARARRYGGPVTVIVLDLDRLEPVNNELGREIGDAMITSVARAIRERLRESDVIARLGGDEFGVLLPDADEQAAATVARDLLRVAKTAVVEVPDGGIAWTSASIGLAHDPNPADTDWRALISAAATAMEESKRAGGDRLAVAKPFAGTDRPPYPTWA